MQVTDIVHSRYIYTHLLTSFLPWKLCMIPFDTITDSPQGGGFELNFSSGASGRAWSPYHWNLPFTYGEHLRAIAAPCNLGISRTTMTDNSTAGLSYLDWGFC